MSILSKIWDSLSSSKEETMHEKLFPVSVNADVRLSVLAYATVSKLDYKPSNKVSLAMDALRDRGIEEFVLFGGAIRDDILNVPISDFDTLIHIKELFNLEGLNLQNDETRINEITKALERKGFSEIEHRQSCGSFDVVAAKIAGGAHYDLLIHTNDYDATLRLKGTAEPMSTVIYTSKGECYADRLFTNHLITKTFMYAHAQNDYRYEKLSGKIEDLEPVEDSDASRLQKQTLIFSDNPRIPQYVSF